MEREAELQLVAALKRGAASAFDAVYDEYRPRIFSFVLRLIGRRAVAEEIAQETWLRLATHAGSLRDDTRLGPWLFTVARNLCLSFRRARGLDGVGAPWPELLEIPDAQAPSPERQAEAGETAGRLERALRRLPAHYREALLLVGLEGLTPAEAATVAGIAPEAMRKRLERARGLLAAEHARNRPRAERP